MADSGGRPYQGPVSRVRRLLSSVASQGSILSIAAPYANCSYSVQFYGPSLSCGKTSVSESFESEAVTIINRGSTGGASTGERLAYVAFTPQVVDSSNESGDGLSLANNALRGLNMTFSSGAPSIGTIDEDRFHDHARFYIYVPRTSSFIECGLFNYSYTIDFSFVNGEQNVTVRSATRLNGVVHNCDQLGGCTPSTLAYISVMDAFGQLLLGQFSVSRYGYMSISRTQIHTSVLMQSKELQTELREKAPLSIANMSLSEGLEQVFLNTTLSLFSDSYFL
jgi:hypothetical protein